MTAEPLAEARSAPTDRGTLANEEAALARARRVGSEHLLPGVLRSGGGVSRALEAEGITVDSLRRCLRGNDVEGRPSNARDDGAGRAVLAGAVEIARARRASHMKPEHLVLAAIDGRHD